ncbi:GDSL-like lipase/acylhydrolase family protein [Novosphingobium sp. PhB165]|uniref:SGNH/GDSL hydrolase family protein n=1 Tax=Novosphingobium sp. PhB165 TaxID=2485105 RepID=UPI0010527413|nr:SGNH/GDSL hydrolase family protein [Novosphingobium sp. PhB165]TCM22368.1 GDSL-like lipase/acylhydrolase family protein [Novosphingobium sp. PhB165]
MPRNTLAGLTATALLLGGCATSFTTAHAAQADPTAQVEETLAGQRYVAIGSSFAAGPMLPPAKGGAPARCGQSLNNYPSLLAERFGMVLTDRSCSGATTDNVLGPWGDIAPQINAVTPQTRLVTLTIGGNDLNYVGNLFNASCAYRAKQSLAAGGKPRPCAAVKIPTEYDYARDEMQLMEIARRIRTQAPHARLVFVQYLTPLPAPGKLCADTPISEEHAAIVRQIGVRLADITTRVASANGAVLVEMNQSSATHTPCDAMPWMIGSPDGYDGHLGLQWHLNYAGMEATANEIAWWLTRVGVKSVRPNLLPLPVPLVVPPPVPPQTTSPTGTRNRN